MKSFYARLTVHVLHTEGLRIILCFMFIIIYVDLVTEADGATGCHNGVLTSKKRSLVFPDTRA